MNITTIIKGTAILALFLVALAFGSQNQELVTFSFLIAKGNFHLSTLLGLAFISGFAVCTLVSLWMQMKLKRQVKVLRKKLRKYEPNDEKPNKKASSKSVAVNKA
ncbi:LapA family protein [Vibrio sagamiensis]|uniref:Probable lipopolysaccharide assembly protein A n=1 Tax=Vibrio sagamiensis NBRC 104589 TaxID=1219064 RepID=A0A511QIZ3_9VIBR|nr:lipopolysaccharide assembly protein LapA domain-containing protein [Vibrio sagamiensis]PNQ59261.1 DUF1049 domain-containing protein [Vibrio agarivorans]GEM77157.1 putative lipopolysaccharide assembly protein A [Vibrio sagamiensis NBRC 104589]